MKFSDTKNHLTSESVYLKLKDGDNRVRIVCEPVLLWKSFDDNNKMTGLYLSEEKAKNDKRAKKRFALYVINRENAQIQIAEFGPQIIGQLVDLQMTEDYKFDDLPPYDIIIRKSGTGLDTEYKVVAARMNTELTEDEKIKILELESLEQVLAKDAVDANPTV